MKLDEFDFELPDELIAQRPPSRRDESRLLLFDRSTGEIRETRFSNFPRYCVQGDLVVVNETRVLPARIHARRASGGAVEILLTRRSAGRTWEAMIRPSRRIGEGEELLLGDGPHRIRVERRLDRLFWVVSPPAGMPERVFLHRWGSVPLPPYIKRADGAEDRERYQTVFARRDGSVAAPTAGLHFTEEILREIKHRGVTIVPLTLHVGPGTFRPLDCEEVERNELAPEFVMIKREYWEEIVEAKRRGQRIVAVGTTTTRALESLAAGRLEELEERDFEGERYLTGHTRLFIHPGFTFTIVDALLTNLHLPRSSLLVLAASFAGRDEILRVYRWAIARRFRFYSYGDVMFIR